MHSGIYSTLNSFDLHCNVQATSHTPRTPQPLTDICGEVLQSVSPGWPQANRRCLFNWKSLSLATHMADSPQAAAGFVSPPCREIQPQRPAGSEGLRTRTALHYFSGPLSVVFALRCDYHNIMGTISKLRLSQLSASV